MEKSTFSVYEIPLSTALSWPKADLINPPHKVWTGPFSISLSAVVTIVVAVRTYARATGRAGPFGLDDVLVLLALACNWVITGLQVRALNLGIGMHIWDIPSNLYVDGAFVSWLLVPFIIATTSFTKISILLFYRRLTDRTYGSISQWAIYFAIITTLCYFVTFTIGAMLICRPLDAYWKSIDFSYSQPYTCIHMGLFTKATTIFSLVSDVFALAIPTLVIKQLCMPVRQKIVLLMVFGCGILPVIAGTIRIIYVFRMFDDRLNDVTWIGMDVLVWSEVEQQLAVVCASVPALKGLLCSRSPERQPATEQDGAKSDINSTATVHSHDSTLSAPQAAEAPNIPFDTRTMEGFSLSFLEIAETKMA